MEIVSRSIEETARAAAQFLETLSRRSREQACLVTLSGDLGSGKTTFVQEAAKLLGVGVSVPSPTFIIERIYKLDHPEFSHLIHIDAYRLESGGEMLHLGWREIIADPRNVIFVEWPEKISNILPENRFEISCEFVDDITRRIRFSHS